MIERNLHAVFDLEYHLVIVTKYRHLIESHLSLV
mgnify:CR=1 FL=1